MFCDHNRTVRLLHGRTYSPIVESTNHNEKTTFVVQDQEGRKNRRSPFFCRSGLAGPLGGLFSPSKWPLPWLDWPLRWPLRFGHRPLLLFGLAVFFLPKSAAEVRSLWHVASFLRRSFLSTRVCASSRRWCEYHRPVVLFVRFGSVAQPQAKHRGRFAHCLLTPTRSQPRLGLVVWCSGVWCGGGA